jgi:hypothetical protein
MIIEIIVYLSLAILSAYAADQISKKGREEVHVEPGDLQIATNKEGTPYTILFGMVYIENPIIDWWGDKSVTAIRKKVGEEIDWEWGLPGHGSSTNSVYQTIGHKYKVGINFHLCQGVTDGVKQIRVGKKLIWPDPDDKETLQADGVTNVWIDQPNIFGGDESEGGVEGRFRVQYGSASQSVNAYRASILGSNISADRGVTSVTLEQMYIGTSPYLKNWSFLLKRTDVLTDGSTQWYLSKADISNNLNPAHIIRECMTNTKWGLGQSVTLFDDTIWQGVADALYTEGFGLSLKWESEKTTVEDFIRDVLRHIDAVLYQDMTTGEFVLKLIRDDYDAGTLTTYDDDDIVAVNDFQRSVYGEVADEIWVDFWDILDHKKVSIPDQNTALIDMQGGKVSPLYRRYYGVTDPTLAAKLAARDRQQISAFNATFKLIGKRTMYDLYPGDVFKMTWDVLGIQSMIVRVLGVNYGSLRNGEIEFVCSEDVFSMQESLFDNPPNTGWSDPNNDPADVTVYKLLETPYYELVRYIGVTEVATLDNDAGFLSIQALDPTGDSFDYGLMLRDSPAGSFYEDGIGYFCPTATISADMLLNAQDVVVTLENVVDLGSVDTDTYAVIGNEIVKVKNVDTTNSQVTLARGCLDTIPELHSGPDSGGSGAARIWFMNMVNRIGNTEYSSSDQPGVKLLPRTILGSLAEGSATARNATAFDSRMIRPYAPGDFKVNGSSYPASFSGQPTISWKHRDRTQQTEEIVEHSDSSVGPEAGTTYTLTIHDEDDVQVRQVTGLSGTSYTYQEADEISDCGIGSGEPLNSKLRFKLKAVRGGYDSWQEYDLWVNRV